MRNDSRIVRTVTTARYLRPSQIWHRILYRAEKVLVRHGLLNLNKKYVRKVRNAGLAVSTHFNSVPYVNQLLDGSIDTSVIAELNERCQRIEKLDFEFLNRRRKYDQHVQWNDESVSHLWRYHLHYFSYAIDLGCMWRVSGEERFYDTFKTLVIDWIRGNARIGRGDAWHPYTISQRLVNWSYAFSLFRPRLSNDREMEQLFFESYLVQAFYLLDHLELDVLGNHLIENARALIFAGLLLEGTHVNCFLDTGLKILCKQLEEQILSDGGHYERSPMYHQIVLRDVLEIIQLLITHNIPVPEIITSKAKLMIEFQNQTLHPDGGIALLNDSALNFASDAQTIRLFGRSLNLCETWKGDKLRSPFDFCLINIKADSTDMSTIRRPRVHQVTHFVSADTGYYVYRDRDTFLITDFGEPCPDFLPAHAHADFGTFELSVRGSRWVVDSGVYEYQGPLRNIYRGTEAHNCLVVDGHNQSDVWASFRMGNRAKPLDVQFAQKEGIWAVAGGHSGYSRMKVNVRRKFFVLERSILVVLDEVKCSGEHLLQTYIHFHPSIEVHQDIDNFKVTDGIQTLFVVPFATSGVQLDRSVGKYSPEFGKQLDCCVVSASTRVSSGSHVLGYVITNTNRVNVRITKSSPYELAVGQKVFLFDLIGGNIIYEVFQK
jgi:uncharacterized heparinase superfamily protein